MVNHAMCRLLGIVSARACEARDLLREAPRSLAKLSQEHRDGWGVAVHRSPLGWSVHKGILQASEDTVFHALAASTQGELVVAHVRQKTVGETSIANTHPFSDGGFVFAHNGTVRDVPFLETMVADDRRARFKGDTDSERLFHALLTRFERDGVSPAEPLAFRRSFVSFFRDLRSREGLGSFNVVLSDGKTLWAHRFGRTLAVLRRDAADAGCSVLIASERLTDEAWVEVPDGTVLEVAGGNEPTLTVLDGTFVF